mmetsp:Transcript_37265/g.79114  ORF Transcript_37265/g.79114 Transcript_37265/m.79114 type:complete len:106 (+) Transcript_37265:185-502(+)
MVLPIGSKMVTLLDFPQFINMVAKSTVSMPAAACTSIVHQATGHLKNLKNLTRQNRQKRKAGLGLPRQLRTVENFGKKEDPIAAEEPPLARDLSLLEIPCSTCLT